MPEADHAPADQAHPRLIGIGLMLMSLSSGCMDIVSYRFLGQVFTSAMTGNVALMGLDLGQANMEATGRNATAFAGFVAGLASGALLLRARADRRALLGALLVELVLLVGFAAGWPWRAERAAFYGLIAVSAVAMGLQSAVAQRIGVPGISSTYFTGTLTRIVFGLLGGARPRSEPLGRVRWPLLAFLSYLTGAVLAGAATLRSRPKALGLPALPAFATAVLLLMLALAGRRRR